MANGRAAALEAHDPLAGEPFLAIGEIAGRAAAPRILLAAALTLDDIERIAGASIETVDELSFERASASLRARRRRRLSALVLAEQTLAVPQDEAAALMLARGTPLARARAPAVDESAQAAARPGDVPGPRRGRCLAGPLGRSAQRRSCVARAVPHRQNEARRHRRRRPRERPRRDAALGPQAAPR